MRVELLLQIAMATMTALGTLLLGMGERQVTLPLIAVVVSASSVYLTDVSGWLRLNPRVANVAGSSAVVIFVWDFLQRFGQETQLLAVANLLIYLQFVLLYQKKSESTYWLLALLSLLQVAVATALNFELIFGILLFAYLVCGLAALGLFFLHRELESFDAAPMLAAPPKSPQCQDARRWMLDVGDSAIQTRGRYSEPGEVLGWRFSRQMGALTAATLGVALLFFFIVPRVGQKSWQSPVGSPQTMIGASNEVTLDEFGPITENPEVVMRIALYQGDSNQTYTLKEAPLFRGPILTHYSRGTWRQAADIIQPIHPPEVPSSTRGLVRQVIQMRPLEVESVYCVGPVIGVREGVEKQLHFNRATEQIIRAQPARDQTIEVYTTGFANGRQTLFMPNTIDQYNVEDLTLFPADDMPHLVALADALVAHIHPDDALARARTLTNHLHDSGLYQYELMAPKRNPAIDPIEDFLSEHRQGHCEYFASALALMLRSVGIPSRVVLGFNGGEYNAVGGFYQVRQLHAHAWVEAYLTSRQLPEPLRRDRRWINGGWVTLDATPGAAGAISRIGVTAGIPTFRQIADYGRYLWSSYIMGLDADRQIRTVYEPLVLWTIKFTRRLSDPSAWRALFDRVLALIGVEDPRPARVAAMIGVGALLAAVALLLWQKPRGFARRWTNWLGWGRSRRGAGPQVIVEFYRQLELVLAQFGLSRPETLTQQEFAAMAARGLTARGLSVAAASAPQCVADAFYAVRFGGRRLDKEQVEAVERALAALDEASRAR